MNEIQFNYAELFQKQPLEKDERIVLGGNRQCQCFEYDSQSGKYEEHKDYDMVRLPQRQFYIAGKRQSYKILFYVNMGVTEVDLYLNSRNAERNQAGFWVGRNYKLSIKIQVSKPVIVIQKNIQNVASYVNLHKSEIYKLVRINHTGEALRKELNEHFSDDGLFVTYVDVKPEETSSGLTDQQRAENAQREQVSKVKFEIGIDDTKATGRREQRVKDADTDLKIERKKLALKYTEKQVVLQMMETTLKRLNLPKKDQIRGIAIMASLLGISLPTELLDRQKFANKKRYIENLP